MAESKLSPALQEAMDAIARAIEGMTDEQLSWHPDGKWSSAGILEHLSLAYARTAERMKLVPQQDKLDIRRGTLREWFGALIVLKLGQIPPGRKAPEGLSPKGVSPRQAIASIQQNLAEMDEVLEQCEARFGDKRTVLLHALLGPLSTREWRRFHCVHTLHHMRQIHGLREKMKAPILTKS
ncbi:MAG TPA: DinB family protein [Candidatus Angelobacter sp.]